ncbi:MAG: adenylate/guanylate cyclase domain-containing protein [Patescibacteria group bacterium]
MDFVQKIVSLDEESRTFTVILEPDPRRYEWKEIEGKCYLYDKFDNIYFPEQVYFESFKQIIGKPIYFQPQKIDDAEAYIKSRQPLIVDMLEGCEHSPTFKDKSEEFLQSLAMNKLSFVIISLDIVGSTKLATAADSKTYARLISTVLYELSGIIPKFHGHVLKYTGDGMIAYFPEPSFITKNDLAIDCALTLRGLVYKALNPILEERGFPTIDIRIGLDAGEAYVETIGSPETKQHKDIIGAVVSLAAKIQAQAKPGEIYLGDTTERNLHTMWREICEPADLGRDWDYRNSDGNIYKVHRVKLMQ